MHATNIIGNGPRTTVNVALPTRALEQCPALILNADYRPLSYLPLSIWSWQEAVKAIFRGTVSVVYEYEREISSPSQRMKLPSVLVMKEYVPEKRTPTFSRFNVFLRDHWKCQYCGDKFRTQALTFDHVIPRAKGGETTWQNIVAACQCCNATKGSKLPSECNMHPLHEPRQPSIHELEAYAQKFPPNFLHKEWEDFLYWDSELEDGYVH